MSGLSESFPICTSTSVINQMCNNRWQVLTDARLDKNASLTGGELAGTIENQGLNDLQQKALTSP